MPPEKLTHDFVVLRPSERADGKDEESTGGHERGDRIEDRPLHGAEPSGVGLRPTPADLGVAAQRSEPRTRGVHEDRIETGAEGGASRIGDDRWDGNAQADRVA